MGRARVRELLVLAAAASALVAACGKGAVVEDAGVADVALADSGGDARADAEVAVIPSRMPERLPCPKDYARVYVCGTLTPSARTPSAPPFEAPYASCSPDTGDLLIAFSMPLFVSKQGLAFDRTITDAARDAAGTDAPRKDGLCCYSICQALDVRPKSEPRPPKSLERTVCFEGPELGTRVPSREYANCPANVVFPGDAAPAPFLADATRSSRKSSDGLFPAQRCCYERIVQRVPAPTSNPVHPPPRTRHR